MANMSYCMFENTMRDLRDCAVTLDEAESLTELDLSRTERAAYNQMKELCEQFLEAAARLEESESEGDDFPLSMEYDEGE